VSVTNFSNDELIIPKATVLGVAEEMTGEVAEKTNSEGKEGPSLHNPAQKIKRNENLYRKLLQGKLNHLKEEERKVIEPVLLEHAHVFHDAENKKGTDLVEHEILVGNARPKKKPPYALREEMKNKYSKCKIKGYFEKAIRHGVPQQFWSLNGLLMGSRSLDLASNLEH